MKRSTYRPRTNVTALLALMLAITTVVANFGAAYAATLTTASLALSDPRPSASSIYTVTANGFTTAQTIGCIEVDLGTASNGTGNAATSTASSVLDSQTITGSGTWTVDNTQSAAQKLRAVNATPVVPQASSRSIAFSAVTNGATPNTSYFAVITTYTTNACTTPVDTTTVQFVYTDGQAVTMAVDGTLTFAVAGVASGLAVNGPNTTVTSTSTTLPFGTVTTAANQIAAQDLTVTTNAGNGYTVFTRYTGQLASGANNIANHSGTNAAPVVFTAAGTEGFGYTTNDATLSGGSPARFSSNKWAAFALTNAEVAFNGAGITNDVTRVGLQTGISTATKPGSYATTVVYTATPIY